MQQISYVKFKSSIFFFDRIYIQPWYVKQRYAKAEEHANIIYELHKKRILQEEQNKS